MTAPLLEPYLFFGGRCEEALALYAACFGGEVTFLMRYRDNPQPMKPGTLPPGFEDKVMHATLRIGPLALMASDGCDTDVGFKGFRLSFAAATQDEARRIFAALSAGGRVDMPPAKTFWSPLFGMLTDRFGVGWMITVAEAEPATADAGSRTAAR